MRQILAATALAALALGCGAADPASRSNGPSTSAASAPIAAGDRAVDARVVTIDGAETELSSVWSGRPALVIFYRGHW
jgi:hypothetical protein